MDHRQRDFPPRSYNEPGHVHELTFSCHNRLRLLSKDRTCQWLAETIVEAKTDLDYALWAYVFMPDHVHLIVYPRRAVYDISDFLKRIKEPVSRQAVSYLKTHAPDWLDRLVVAGARRKVHRFWQAGRGYDRNITNAKTLMASIQYLHLNPVRKQLCERASQWKWSSAGWFEGLTLNDLQPDLIDANWLNA